MANSFFFSAGISPKKTTGTPPANTFYLSAGLQPVVAAGGSAALTGTIVSGGVTESEIVTGGETLIITLTGDTWVATVGADNAITTALIAGIDSAQAEAAGWNAVVKANMTHNDVARTSDTIVTITLGAESTYAITANETITVTIPATAVTSATEIVADATFDVTNESAGVTIPVLIYSYNMRRA